jgi:hypothetical protein
MVDVSTVTSAQAETYLSPLMRMRGQEMDSRLCGSDDFFCQLGHCYRSAHKVTKVHRNTVLHGELCYLRDIPPLVRTELVEVLFFLFSPCRKKRQGPSTALQVLREGGFDRLSPNGLE